MIVYYDSVPYIIEDPIQHSGILDMKWGQRRFRNYDGTLTEAGKLRYRKKRSVKDLSDEELSNSLRRLKAENDYISALSKNRELTAPKWKKRTAAGVKIAGKILGTVGGAALKSIGSSSSFIVNELIKDLQEDAKESRETAVKQKVSQPKPQPQPLRDQPIPDYSLRAYRRRNRRGRPFR